MVTLTLEDLVARVERLEKALMRYGRHLPSCSKTTGREYFPNEPCSCGLDSLIAWEPPAQGARRD